MGCPPNFNLTNAKSWCLGILPISGRFRTHPAELNSVDNGSVSEVRKNSDLAAFQQLRLAVIQKVRRLEIEMT